MGWFRLMFGSGQRKLWWENSTASESNRNWWQRCVANGLIDNAYWNWIDTRYATKSGFLGTIRRIRGDELPFNIQCSIFIEDRGGYRCRCQWCAQSTRTHSIVRFRLWNLEFLKQHTSPVWFFLAASRYCLVLYLSCMLITLLVMRIAGSACVLCRRPPV